MVQGEIVSRIVEMPDAALALREPAWLEPIMDLKTAKDRLAKFQAFVDEYLVEGEDYGKFPGAQKPALYKSGADKLCELYALSDDYEEVRSTIDFVSGLFDYEFRCILSRGGRRVTVGLGSCSSYESKYKYRDAARKCPDCKAEAIIKGKEEFGGGFVCWTKRGGCGQNFDENDERITKQKVGKVENENKCDVKNTVLKMAKKRAKIDATLSATRSSGIFTQADDDEADAAKPAGAKSKPTAAASASGYISEQERKGVFAAMGRAKLEHGDLKKFLFEKHKVDSTTKMTRAIADDVLVWLRVCEAIFAAADRAKLPHADVKTYLAESLKVDSITNITGENADAVIEWLTMIEKGEK